MSNTDTTHKSDKTADNNNKETAQKCETTTENKTKDKTNVNKFTEVCKSEKSTVTTKYEVESYKSGLYLIPSKKIVLAVNAAKEKKIAKQSLALSLQLKDLQESIKTNNASNVAASKELVVETLASKGIKPAGGKAKTEDAPEDIIEMVDLLAAKTIFCQVKLIHGYINSAPADAIYDYNNVASATDVAQIKTLFCNELKAMNWSFDGRKELDGHIDIDGTFGDWITQVNKDFKGKDGKGIDHKGENALFAYKSNYKLALMRYYAGASLVSKFDLSTGQFFIKSKAEAKFNVVEGEMTHTLHIPSEKGFHLIFTHNKQRNEGQEGCIIYEPIQNLAISDLTFETGSSFIRPDRIKALHSLKQKLDYLRREHKKKYPNKVARFKCQFIGHTDKQGTDKSNLLLGERRAKSVYAFLTKDADYWESLYSDLESNRWGSRYIGYMLKTVLPGYQYKEKLKTRTPGLHIFEETKNLVDQRISAYTNSDDVEKDVKRMFNDYQRLRELPITKTVSEGKLTRKFLFVDYMTDRLHDIGLTDDDFMKTHLKSLGETQVKENTEKASEKNRRVEFMIYTTSPEIQTLDLGYYRCVIDAKANAFVGANIVAGVDIECELSPSKLLTKNNDEANTSPIELKGVKRVNKAEALKFTSAKTEDLTALKNQAKKNKTDWDESKNAYSKESGLTNTKTNKDTEGYIHETGTFTDSDGNKFAAEATHGKGTTTSKEQVIGATLDGNLSHKKTTNYENGAKAEFSGSRESEASKRTGANALNVGAKASGSMFAGAEAGGEFLAKLQWKSIEKNSAFVSLAGVGAQGAVNAGAGLKGEFDIAYKEGKFLIKAAAGATLGIGVSYGMTYEVYAVNLYDFVIFVYTQLRDADFNYLAFMEKDAFEVLTVLLAYAGAIKDKIENITESIDEFVRKADNFFGDAEEEKRADTICKNIKKNPEIIKYCTPEARGKLINAILQGAEVRGLSGYSLFGTNEDYEIAIVSILQGVQSQRDFAHTIYCSLPEKEREIHEAMPESKRTDMMVKARARLEQFLDGQEQQRFDRLEKQLPQVAPKSSAGPVQPNGLI